MPLQKSVIEIPFGTSMDESVAKQVLEPGAMALVQNAVVSKKGSYSKRRGVEALPKTILGGGSISAGFAVYDYDQRAPCMTDGSSLYDYSESDSAWANCGLVPECEVRRSGGLQAAAKSTPYIYEMVVIANRRLIVYTVPLGANASPPDYVNSSLNNRSDIYYSVQDATTGAVLVPTTYLDRMVGPGVCPTFTLASTSSHVVLTALIPVVSGDYQLRAYVWHLSASATAAPTQDLWSVGTGGGGGVYALDAFVTVTPEERSGQLVYLYRDATGDVGTEKIRKYTPATLVSSVATSPVLSVDAGLGQRARIHYDSSDDKLWIAWIPSPATSTQKMSVVACDWSNLSVLATFAGYSQAMSTTAIHTIASCLNGADLVVNLSCNINGGTNSYIDSMTYHYAASSITGVDTGRRENVASYSDPFIRGGRVYQWVIITPLTADTVLPYEGLGRLMLTELQASTWRFRPVANVAQNLVSTSAFPLKPHRPFATTASTWEILVPVVRAVGSAHLEVAAADFSSVHRLRSARYGDVMLLSGASPAQFDGAKVVEQGFLYPPNITVATSAPSGDGQYLVGPDSGTGSYAFFAIWERTDSQGNVHRSEPSNIEFITLAAGDMKRVVVTSIPLVVTSSDNTRLIVYRTRLDGTTYYRDNETSAATAAGTLLTVEVFAQDLNELFYTQIATPGASQYRYSPPPLRCLTNHGSCVCGVAEDGKTIWFSGQHVPGEGVWWSPAFISYIDDHGYVTALASMDGRLYVFTRNAIWLIDGDGFADNGEGGYTIPQRLAVDAGCIDERSVVVTPAGTMFRSDLGVALLDRSGSVSFFGWPVQDTLAEYPTITGASLDRVSGDVKLSLTAGSGQNAWLSWDYRVNVWTRHLLSMPSVTAEGSSVVVTDDVARWHVAMSDGTVLRVADAVSDTYAVGGGASFVSTMIETPWIKAQGLQGFQRVWRVLTLFSVASGPPGLRVSLLYDYEDSVSESRTWTASEVASLPRDEVEIHCKRQRCIAIKVRLECVAGNPTDAVDWLGTRLVIGAKGKTPMGKPFR